MTEQPFSPKDFLRRRRPEMFSDTMGQGTPTLDRAVLDYYLDSLTARNQHTEFERFARNLAQKVVCPNLLPQTGPTGGGDSKTDASTYPVSESLALAWYVGSAQTASASEPWAFAFSAKKKWKPKLEDDIGKLVATGRGYKQAFFVTNQYVRDKERAATEDELTKKHGISVHIFDRSWILEKVFEGHHEQLAIDELGMSISKTTPPEKGAHDYEREAELKALEDNIRSATEEERFTIQLVDDCIEAAKLSRNLEHPRSEVDGRLARATTIAARYGTQHQQLRAAYETAATAFWWWQDQKVFDRNYMEVERLAQGSLNIYDLKLLYTLWMLLRPIMKTHANQDSAAVFARRTEILTAELTRFTKDQHRASAALEARTMLLEMQLIGASPADSGPLLDEMKTILEEAEPLAGYPLNAVVRIFQELGQFLGELPAYQRLLETAVELTAKREGEVAAARILVKAGLQHLEAKRPYSVIQTIGKALGRLYKQESRDELVRALYMIGIAYEQVGLLWAARGATVTAAALATSDFWKYSEITSLQGNGYHRAKWLELQLGRLPQLLAWHELDLVHGYISPANNAERRQQREMFFDAIVGILLLRSSLADLRVMTRLPQTLERLQLLMSESALRYALGDVEGLPSDVGGDREAFVRSWIKQPAAASLPGRPELYNEPTVTMVSRVLGCKFVVTATNANPCVETAESLLATIESFLSTALLHSVFPRDPIVTIEVTKDPSATETLSFSFTEIAGRVHVAVVCGSFDAHSPGRDVHGALTAKLESLVLELVARSYIVPDTEKVLTQLFRDERAAERAVSFSSSFVVTGNVLGDNPATTLDRWIDNDAIEYPLTRTEVWSAHERVDELVEPSSFGTGATPPELLDRQNVRHDEIDNPSLIRPTLWDKAGWSGTFFITSPSKDEPPVMAFIFSNATAGEEIFSALREDLGGDTDDKERLRITVVRGIHRSHPFAYRIVVGTDLTALPATSGGQLMVMSRMNRMDAKTDANLKRFLEAYERSGAYLLMAAEWPDQKTTPQPILDTDILKRRLIVREAYEIGVNDPDAVGVDPDDDFIVPEEVSNAPAAKLQEWKKEQRSAPPADMPGNLRNKPCPCGSGKKFKKCHGK